MQRCHIDNRNSYPFHSYILNPNPILYPLYKIYPILSLKNLYLGIKDVKRTYTLNKLIKPFVELPVYDKDIFQQSELTCIKALGTLTL